MKRELVTNSILGFLSASAVRYALVMILICAMVINGFVPRSEEGKNSLFVVMTAVVSNMVVDTFKECADTLTAVSNRITKDLYKYLNLGETGADVPSGAEDKKEPMPVNTSSEAGITPERRVGQIYTGYKLEDLSVIGIVPTVTEKLYRLYGHVKEYCSKSGTMGILFFVLFVIVIRNRKEEIISWEKIADKYKTDLR